MSTPGERVRIGIVTWNVAGVIEACLDSLPAALAGTQADIVVVDNASVDATADLLSDRLGITLICNRSNRGYAQAMNQALGAPLPGGAPDVLIALNPDTVVPPGSLERLVSYLRDNPSVGLVVPRLVNPDGREQHSVHTFPSPLSVLASSFLPPSIRRGAVGRHYRLEGVPGPDSDAPVDWAIGAVHVMRAAAVGSQPYNERWFIYGEDLDLCWQLAMAGWERHFVATVKVVHVGNVSGRAAFGSQRAAKVWSVTHDWYRLRRGAGRARIFAAANILAVGYRASASLVKRILGRPVPAWDSGLLTLLGVHARALMGRG